MCSFFNQSDCHLSNADGEHTVVIYDGSGGPSTGGYQLRTQGLNNPQGCAVLPSLAFGQAPVAATLGEGFEQDCFHVELAGGDRVRLRPRDANPAAPDTFVAELLGPDGVARCGRSTTLDYVAQEAGSYSVVVARNGPVETGDYRLHAQRLNDPQGCASIASLSFDGSSGVGRDGKCRRARLLRFPATDVGDVVRARSRTTTGNMNPLLELIRPRAIGSAASAPRSTARCSAAQGADTLLVGDGFEGSGTGGYAFHVYRLTNPTGCASLPATAFGRLPTGSIRLPGTGLLLGRPRRR